MSQPEWLTADEAALVNEIVKMARIARAASLTNITVATGTPTSSVRADTASPVDYGQGQVVRDGPRPVGHEDILLVTLLQDRLRRRGEDR